MKTSSAPIRFFLIEDDEMTRELLTIQLVAQGYLVETADSGEAALRQLRETGHPLPGVILTDLQMPGISGVELAQQLRSLAKGEPSKLVLLGMSASRPDADLMAAFDGFLLKPFTVEQLAASLAAPVHASSQERLGSELAAPSHSLDQAIYGKLESSLPATQLQQLYSLCISDAQVRIERMRLAAASDDDATFRIEAHAIKGSSSMVGAIELQRLAAEAETFGIQHANYVVSLDEMQRACERLQSMLVAQERRAI